MTGLYFDHRWCAQHGIGRFASEVRARLSGFSDLPSQGSPTSLLDSVRLSRTLKSVNAKFFFSPGFNVPLRPEYPVVCTIHDLIHIHYRAESSFLKRQYYSLIQRPVVRRSPLVLTVSEFSRSQIIEWYGIDEKRVVCVGNGISEAFHPKEEGETSEAPYFLFTGNHKPHKNVPTLLRAYAKFESGMRPQLHFVGKAEPGSLELIRQLGVGETVQFHHGISDAQLAKLYRGAIATILPSYFEGFGLPIVEAMACGCPVIGADATAIPEVMGDAGLLFAPDDPDALFENMSRLIEDASLRSELKRRGLERARLFTWDNVGARVRNALQDVLSLTEQS